MKLARDPLMHFLIIGAILFGAFHLVGADDEPDAGEIIVSAGRIANLEAIFSQTWQRPPTEKETEALIRDYVRDEVLYREGVAMGLDQDDAIIRRRIRQKVEFVTDLTADVQPTDAELKAFVDDHPERFLAEPRFSFAHVYFRADAGGPDADEIERMRRALNAGTMEASAVGSPFIGGFDFQGFTKSAIAQTFGTSFAEGIERASSEGWEGPVTSAYGIHLVRVNARGNALERPFDEVREAARREWLHDRKVAVSNALYEKLRSRYNVKVDKGSSPAGGEKLAEVEP